MSNITLLAIDLAKNVFQLHGTDRNGKVVLKMKVTRGKLIQQIANMNPCKIYMEACGSANYWGREFSKYGHTVKLMNPRDIKAYMGRNKNDKNDAAGIARAARDPEAKFCQVKTEQQQDMQGTHRIRSQIIQHRTALANQIRGLLAEYGIIIPKGINNIRKILPEILDGNRDRLSQLMLINFEELYENLLYLDKKVEQYDKRIKSLFGKDELCKKLATIPGIGVLNATILSSILGNGSGFRNGRHFAAFLGLTPKQNSSGEKERLLGISKGGDTYLRTLLVHGARAVMLRVDKNKDKLSNWVRGLKTRNHSNVVAVALANKIARIAWAVSKFRTDYNPNYVNCLFKKEAKCSGELTTALSRSAFARPLCHR
jgi:transposase